MPLIRIDGSAGEGGGQVLRTALAMSMITGNPVALNNIRAKRQNPGLAPQHLAGVKAAGLLCNAAIQGASLGSANVTFEPTLETQPGHYDFDIATLANTGSAGATTLLLQTILLPLSLSAGPSRVVIRGGTHVAWSPPVHYLDHVLLPLLIKIGITAHISLDTWGWYPRGGGQITVSIAGNARLRAVNLSERGQLENITGVAGASNLPSHIPQRISGRANNLLRENNLPATITPLRTSSQSAGVGIFLAAEFNNSRAGFSALGKKGKPSEIVANEAIEDFLRFLRENCALDRYSPDQLLPALALAEGQSTLSTIEITQHTLTNTAVIQQFISTPITITGHKNQPGTIDIN